MKYLLLILGCYAIILKHIDPIHANVLSTHAVTSPADSGRIVYANYCLPCHQADGRGVAKQNPPLAKTDWVLGDKTRLIKVVLNGLNETIEIDGEEYDNPMPPHTFLTDKAIADVLSYIRNNFGNKADAISPQEVKAVRQSIAEKKH